MKKQIITAKEILEKGRDLNKLHSEYKNAEGPRIKKSKWRTYYAASEEYRDDFAEFMKSNSTEVVKTL